MCVCVCVELRVSNDGVTYQACSHLQTSQGRNQIARARKARNDWILGTWNVRSMVNTEGPIEVASQSAERGEDRKVDQAVCELAKYGLVVERPSGLGVRFMR